MGCTLGDTLKLTFCAQLRSLRLAPDGLTSKVPVRPQLLQFNVVSAVQPVSVRVVRAAQFEQSKLSSEVQFDTFIVSNPALFVANRLSNVGLLARFSRPDTPTLSQSNENKIAHAVPTIVVRVPGGRPS